MPTPPRRASLEGVVWTPAGRGVGERAPDAEPHGEPSGRDDRDAELRASIAERDARLRALMRAQDERMRASLTTQFGPIEADQLKPRFTSRSFCRSVPPGENDGSEDRATSAEEECASTPARTDQAAAANDATPESPRASAPADAEQLPGAIVAKPESLPPPRKSFKPTKSTKMFANPMFDAEVGTAPAEASPSRHFFDAKQPHAHSNHADDNGEPSPRPRRSPSASMQERISAFEIGGITP